MLSFPRLAGVWTLAVASARAVVPIWGQCGGINYTGDTQCASGLSCVVVNDWYFQCQTSTTTAPQPTTTPATSTTASRTTTTTTSTTGGGGPPAATIPAGVLTKLNNFGPNPSNVGIYVYKPSSVTSRPALIVALHYCSGTAQAYYGGTQWKNLADQRGFIVLYGNTPASGGCWDVASSATLKHDAGGDSLGIASAVRYAISNWGVDSSKVFVTGSSSGAMMTNVLAGAYPDLFKAGAAFAGVPYACFAGSSSWNSQCAGGQLTHTPQEWGNLVRQGYAGYTGAYPRIQLWHGTADTTLYYQNFLEAVKQWTNVHGISQTATSTSSNTPLSGWTKSVYGSGQVHAYSAQGVTHDLPTRESDALAFFGL